MTESIHNVFNVSNSYFYQKFDSNATSAMFTITAKNTSWIYVTSSIVRALITSNITNSNDNYGLIKTIE